MDVPAEAGGSMRSPAGTILMKPIGRSIETSWMVQSHSKRLVDMTGSALALIILSPMLLVLGLLIRLSSPGPALFRQERIGRNGRRFWLYKFRTMNESGHGSLVTVADDPRITRLGRQLRRSKLDELPQLYNVLRGDMSLVGPRPEVPKYVACYTEEQQRILRVRPGIVGAGTLAYPHEETVLAGSRDVDATYVERVLPAKLTLELEYLDRWSLAGDFRLLCCNAAAVLMPTPPPQTGDQDTRDPCGETPPVSWRETELPPASSPDARGRS
jgi:lipopolysaccharide/colanic/teichoic acid biosynthesis glycosyltransferase